MVYWTQITWQPESWAFVIYKKSSSSVLLEAKNGSIAELIDNTQTKMCLSMIPHGVCHGPWRVIFGSRLPEHKNTYRSISTFRSKVCSE